MNNLFTGKQILVLGGTGSIGSALVKRLLDCDPKVIRVLSNDEDALFNLSHELKKHELKLRFLVGDIREKERLDMAMENIDIVYQAAALKQVPLCEYNPFEAIKTNVLGTQNAIEVSRKHNIDKFIFISTDKSIEPVNTMGATKLLGERLTIDANYYKGLFDTKFSCVRFGNVLNSRGSVIPVWRSQMKKNQSLTITDKEMTRFIITIQEAVDLILKSTELMKGGEIFIIKNMKSVNIDDLINAVRDKYCSEFKLNPEDIRIEIIGKRPGEKLHEHLMTETESAYAMETEDLFIILPTHLYGGSSTNKKDYPNAKFTTRKYFSSKDEPKLNKNEIEELL